MRFYTCSIALCLVLFGSRANAQTFQTILSFSGSVGTAIGINPYYGSLALSGTTLYGMTSGIGTNFNGNVFSVGTDGTSYQNLLSFTGTGGTASGRTPFGSLTLSGTTLYGMTSGGGATGQGNVFSIGVNGSNYQNLVSFTGTGGTASGDHPWGGLTLVGTALFGMTQYGGANGDGNVFSVGSDGTNYQNVVSFTFNGGTPFGYDPCGSLTLAGTTLYGMTLGNNVFSVGADGTNYQNLVYFTGTGGTASGVDPYGSLTLSGTMLYGMTHQGGAKGDGNIFRVGSDGTNYQNLVSFTGTGGTASGKLTYGSLTLVGTTLYGMTIGGAYNVGNIFSLGIDGSGYQDLHDFTGGADGGTPCGDFTMSGGTLFGMTVGGGTYGKGTVFAYVVPTATPEPGTLTLAGSAATVLVAYRWRRRRGRWRGVGGGRRLEATPWRPASLRRKHAGTRRRSEDGSRTQEAAS
jgi:uncharacterized repeat protein (TIGR03803 family)